MTRRHPSTPAPTPGPGHPAVDRAADRFTDPPRRIRGPARPGIVRSAVVSCVVVLAACSSTDGGSASSNPTVVRVVDGDTVVVRSDSGEETVRLIGVDTPETKHPSKPVQCFGKEATAFTRSLLAEGTEVRLERDVEERDRYDRVLAYVYRLDDGVFVNLELARQGFADALTIAPNVAYSTELVAAVAEARNEQRGLWVACDDFGAPA